MSDALNSIVAAHSPAFDAVLGQIRPYTTLPSGPLYSAWALGLEAIDRKITGHFTDFGSGEAGCALGMALIQRAVLGQVARPVWIFEDFLNPAGPDARDGRSAAKPVEHSLTPSDSGGSQAAIEGVQGARAALGLSQTDVVIRPGAFEHSLAAHLPQLQWEGVALLRIGAPFYRTVRLVLDQVDPIVSAGGVAMIARYLTRDGSARAAHDFLSRRSLAYRLRDAGDGEGSFYVKKTSA